VGQFDQANMTRDFSRGSGTNITVMIQKIPDQKCRRETPTEAPFSEASAASLSLPSPTHIVPTFVRLPKSGTRCPWTGLSRSAICELILPARAPVKSVVLRRRGATRGVRLVLLQSLLDHLHAQATKELSEADLAQEPAPTTSTQ
jgi:hypothetical protein